MMNLDNPSLTKEYGRRHAESRLNCSILAHERSEQE